MPSASFQELQKTTERNFIPRITKDNGAQQALALLVRADLKSWCFPLRLVSCRTLLQFVMHIHNALHRPSDGLQAKNLMVAQNYKFSAT